MGDQTSYENILKNNQISEFRSFVSRYLTQECGRFTIQMFPEGIRVDELNFVMDANLAINRKAYEVVTLAQIKEMKNK